jgi:hypothetical protein
MWCDVVGGGVMWCDVRTCEVVWACVEGKAPRATDHPSQASRLDAAFSKGLVPGGAMLWLEVGTHDGD